MKQPITFEREGAIYLVAPVIPVKPKAAEIEEYAFGKSVMDQLQAKAPNEHLSWFAGHYLEADQPNRNGQMWLSNEIAVSHLTPMLMPVTVMHDPATAVGLIADLAMRTPEKDGVPRTKLETALALWAHRFPEVVEEAEHNHAEGTLMQSMECLASQYDCAECGQSFVKLPHGAEQEHWCAHLKGENGSVGARILRSPTFTGTGLIFGSRGARGADPSAYLGTFADEVAQFHQDAKSAPSPSNRKPKPRSRPQMDEITISKSEYDRLVRERDEHKAASERAAAERDEARQKLDEAEKATEKAEAEQKAAEDKAKKAEDELAAEKEQGRQGELREERYEALGEGFIAKLGDRTKAKLRDQAGTLSDDDWKARLEEVEELVGVKSTEGKDSSSGGGAKDDFTAEEVARFKGGSGGSSSTSVASSPAARRSVISSL